MEEESIVDQELDRGDIHSTQHDTHCEGTDSSSINIEDTYKDVDDPCDSDHILFDRYSDSGTCMNCGETTSLNFCNRCGQKTSTGRLKFSTSIRSAFNYFFNVDKGLLKTVMMLFYRPGYMALDYIRGKRVSYTNPFTLMFLSATVFAILTGIMNWSFGEPFAGVNRNGQGIIDKISHPVGYFLKDIVDITLNSSVIMPLISIPLYTLAIKLFFLRSNKGRYNFTELLFTNAYMSSQRFIIDIALLPLLWYQKSKGSSDIEWLQGILYISAMSLTLKQFYDIKWRTSVFKTILVFICTLILALAVLIVFLILIVLVIKIFDPGANFKFPISFLFH